LRLQNDLDLEAIRKQQRELEIDIKNTTNENADSVRKKGPSYIFCLDQGV
jgi:hypothetical protein